MARHQGVCPTTGRDQDVHLESHGVLRSGDLLRLSSGEHEGRVETGLGTPSPDLGRGHRGIPENTRSLSHLSGHMRETAVPPRVSGSHRLSLDRRSGGKGGPQLRW